jgi:amino acid transporter
LIRWLIRLLLGRRLATREQPEQKVGVLAGVPAVGLDGIASSSYGPEALLAVLIPLGAAGLHYLGPILLVILALLAVLYLSYRQTIGAYPSGGGSYTVAKENLGTNAGLVAAGALMIDYVLNVAVAISAGVAALVSAVPALHDHMLPLCLGVLLLVALVNLRGTVESGWAFALPTYLFLGCFAIVVGTGVTKAVLAGGHPAPVAPPPELPAAAGAASLWLLAHAFASGCTAMTGVEAVSNGVSAFKEPAVRTARRTLTAIVGCLGLLLGGFGYLCTAYGIGATAQGAPGYQSVLSQLAGAVVGRGTFYYVSMGSLLAVLGLSANTSFVGFPRLCRVVAADGFLPYSFALVGRRLVNTAGIVFLTLAAGGLLIAFGGITDRLIPLFAVGAFLAFTLSQAGMVLHWRKDIAAGRSRHASKARLAVNAAGALATGAALAVILVAKFTAGAWITVVVLPVTYALFRLVRRRYRHVARRIRSRGPLDLTDDRPPVVVIPTAGWNKLTDKALRFATQLSPDVIAVHLTALDGTGGEDEADRIREEWREDVEEPARRAGVRPPRLELIESSHRRFRVPILEFLDRVEKLHPERSVAVLVPQVVKRRWWQFLLQDYRAERLRRALLRRGDPRLYVVTVPWYVVPSANQTGGLAEADDTDLPAPAGSRPTARAG